jgi:phosphoribosyl-AMP cyclohydrolase/phosphoribosyl-ATP pyrophosphohydrolase/phosphoribosyl-AMP cyclohydrolase
MTTTGHDANTEIAPAHDGVPIHASAEQLAEIKYDANGLVVAIVQEVTSREILMVAYMDQEALKRTLESGRTWFYSRSRREYWPKGETSGDRQYVTKMSYDCDGDALLIQVVQEGKGACHTGAYSCFFRDFGEPTT